MPSEPSLAAPRSVPIAWTAALALFALWTSPALAQTRDPAEPLVTDRPDFTESTAVVQPGRVQVESGYTFTRDGRLEVHQAGELLVRVGALAPLELRLGLSSFVWSDAGLVEDQGFADTELGIKLRLARPASGHSRARPSVALLLFTSLPTGEEGFGEDELQPEAKLALGWQLSERVALGSNLNAALPSDDGDRFGELSGSASLGLGLTPRIGAFLEYFGFLRESRSNESFLNGGFTLGLSPDLQLDARAGLGFEGPDPDYFVGAGFAWRWGR